jgi:hypothetical protein
VRKTDKSLVASRGASELSVLVFTTVKVYDPARFPEAAAELDRIAGQLAAKGGGKVEKRATVRVDGRKVRAYTLTLDGVPTRLGFVFVEKTEYQLKCSGETGKPCDLLFSSFAVA